MIAQGVLPIIILSLPLIGLTITSNMGMDIGGWSAGMSMMLWILPTAQVSDSLKFFETIFQPLLYLWFIVGVVRSRVTRTVSNTASNSIVVAKI